MKIGFTGTQLGMSDAQKDALARLLTEGTTRGEFHHGDCIGADEEAHDIALACGLEVVIHPPINDAKRAFKKAERMMRPKPYSNRNQDIVLVTDMLIAAPHEMHQQDRGGTWSTVRFARERGRPVKIILPDGSINP